MMTRIPLWTMAFLALVMASAAAQEKAPAPEKPPAQETQVVAMRYTFTSRPIDYVTFIARYRADAEISHTSQPHTALRFGYTRENIGQTFRHTDSTEEDKVRFSADLARTSSMTLRGMNEHSTCWVNAPTRR